MFPADCGRAAGVLLFCLFVCILQTLRAFCIFSLKQTMLSYLFAQTYVDLEIITDVVRYHVIDSSMTKLRHFHWSASVNMHFSFGL